MPISRRAFLKQAATGATAAAAATTPLAPANAVERGPKPRLPDAVGLLYDSTLCIGCKACVAGCKAANGMPPEIDPTQAGWNPGVWDTPEDTSGRTLNIIKVYRNGTMAEKDRATDGFAFIKKQCYHCVDPSCVSCCPVSAMNKDPVTGIVSHDKDRCIGCRYCVFACPFQVPKYEYDDAFGQIQKCQLCRHRLADGQLPGCVESCPTGATLFGRVEDLRKEAHARLALQPGDTYHYPRGDLSGNIGPHVPGNDKVITASYLPEVWGEHVLGGTQALVVAAVPFDRLGLPYRNVPEHSYASQTEGVQHLLYTGMVAPLAVLTGLILLARRNYDQHHPDDEDADQ
jgi:Fe-S-cluster-containing dehydrogenase component